MILIMSSKIKEMGWPSLLKNSKSLDKFQAELKSTLNLSVTGMCNFVVNYENPSFIHEFLKKNFKLTNVFRNTYGIDAVELQQGKPGKGVALQYVDELIYGTVEMREDGMGMMAPVLDGRTGARVRNKDGFVNRQEVIDGEAKDILLIINNIDLSSDFCPDERGIVSSKASGLFLPFRKLDVKNSCRIIFVTNEPLQLPFKISTVTWPGLKDFEAKYLLDGVIELYRSKFTVNISQQQISTICRKLVGLTFSEATDCVARSFQRAVDLKANTVIPQKVVKNLRHTINSHFMSKGNGLTAIEPRAWEDYICPETSNFTHDVKKLMQDFDEIKKLKAKQEEKELNGEDSEDIDFLIEAIEYKIPKVIVLYGKGGVGKSAFPVHLAGLLDFDVWDFNIGATHSKWVGEGAKQMRESLDQILKTSHVVVRIDEYDRGMGSTSDTGEGMHEAHKQVESEFMNWLQNNQEENTFAKRNIIVVLTTNHKENITGPLLRSGRADLVINIDNFDSNSFVETLKTTARRMENRGAKAIGYSNKDDLQNKINSMDLEYCGKIMSENGFTVRDVETLILEMARHDYYYKNKGEGIPWTKENFARIVELSSGSVDAAGSSTKEFEMGDRKFLSKDDSKEEDNQYVLPFIDEDNEYISPKLNKSS